MNTFYCPHCNARLSSMSGEMVRLQGILYGDHFECSAIFHLPAKLGAYDAIVDDHIRLQKGANVEFHCPSCAADLTSSRNNDMAELKMVADDDSSNIVVFNKIYGKQATFVLEADSNSNPMAFGEHQEEYIESFYTQMTTHKMNDMI